MTDTGLGKFLIDENTSEGVRDLLIKQGITPKGFEKIKKLHHEHEQILNIIKSLTKGKLSDLRKWAVAADCSISLIQRAWNYPPNPYYHKFWTLPHCKCPKEKNEEKWPNGGYEYNLSCPLHGDRI